jgi:hypothetical protein
LLKVESTKLTAEFVLEGSNLALTQSDRISTAKEFLNEHIYLEVYRLFYRVVYPYTS